MQRSAIRPTCLFFQAISESLQLHEQIITYSRTIKQSALTAPTNQLPETLAFHEAMGPKEASSATNFRCHPSNKSAAKCSIWYRFLTPPKLV